MTKNSAYISFLVLLTFIFGQCPIALAQGKGVKTYKALVEKAFPHDVSSYTQGLFFHDGKLYESSGQYRHSGFRKTDLLTGKAFQSISIDKRYFAEGSCIFNGKLYILTWREQECLVYDPETLRYLGSFRYQGEGWGLTTDGTYLIMSDGSSDIRFINPDTFMEVKRISVTMNGKPVEYLNELEYIKGEIWANVYTSDIIVRIDPQTGEVNSLVNCKGLLPQSERKPSTDVLNGIAYNPQEDAVYLTGKYWPKIYRIKKLD